MQTILTRLGLASVCVSVSLPVLAEKDPLQIQSFLNYGTINGVVYNDVNKNGLQDVEEQGVSGVIVYVDQNNNGELDAGELSSQTSSRGSFQFFSVPKGNITLRYQLPFGYRAMAEQDVSTPPEKERTDKEFELNIIGGGIAQEGEYPFYGVGRRQLQRLALSQLRWCIDY